MWILNQKLNLVVYVLFIFTGTISYGLQDGVLVSLLLGDIDCFRRFEKCYLDIWLVWVYEQEVQLELLVSCVLHQKQ